MVDVVLSRIVHLVFAALWAGSVATVALVVLPLARDGAFHRTEPLLGITTAVRGFSRLSALVLLLTGGHLAAAGYTADGLVETTNGRLVLLMTLLWLVLTGLVEVGSAKTVDGLDAKKLREPAVGALPIFRAAAIVAVLLLVVAGAITAGATQFV